jgi:hypothetical protein
MCQAKDRRSLFLGQIHLFYKQKLRRPETTKYSSTPESQIPMMCGGKVIPKEFSVQCVLCAGVMTESSKLEHRSPAMARPKRRRASPSHPYRGIRQRAWGRWSAEIRGRLDRHLRHRRARLRRRGPAHPRNKGQDQLPCWHGGAGAVQ